MKNFLSLHLSSTRKEVLINPRNIIHIIPNGGYCCIAFIDDATMDVEESLTEIDDQLTQNNILSA